MNEDVISVFYYTAYWCLKSPNIHVSPNFPQLKILLNNPLHRSLKGTPRSQTARSKCMHIFNYNASAQQKNSPIYIIASL